MYKKSFKIIRRNGFVKIGDREQNLVNNELADTRL